MFEVNVEKKKERSSYTLLNTIEKLWQYEEIEVSKFIGENKLKKIQVFLSNKFCWIFFSNNIKITVLKNNKV